MANEYIVNTMEWALHHKGITIAKRLPDSHLVEIIGEYDNLCECKDIEF